MSKITLTLSKKDLVELRKIWKFNKDNISKEGLHQMKWLTMEDFAGDLLFFGFLKASDDPVAFVRGVRETKSPLFQKTKPEKKNKGKKFEEEFKKAYA